MKIIIQPFSAKLRTNPLNPKNYPVSRWQQIISYLTLQGDHVIQVGVEGEERLTADCHFSLPLKEIEALLLDSDCFVAVDSFLQHYAHCVGKRGVVLWGVSDPLIFGHPEHVNLIKSRDNLRRFQFAHWEDQPYLESVFVQYETVINAVDTFRTTTPEILLTQHLHATHS